jgi:hypothetical protein
MRVLTLLVLLIATSASAQMLNDQGPPQLRVVHKNTFALRVNPLGLIYDGRFSVRERLFVSDSKALRDNFIGVGLLPCASPAFFRIGPFIEFNPISMFGVYAAIQYVQYFGTIDLAQGFAGAQSNFSDSAIKANSATNHMVTNGWDLTFGATFQTKVWNVLIRDQAKLVRGVLKLKEGQRIYYDQYFDVGAPNGGWFFTNDFDLLYQALDNHLMVGARYTFTNPFYEERHYDPADDSRPNNAMHRVGPFVGYNFKMQDGAAFNNPTVFLLVQWWVVHRFRTGLDTPQALPLLGVGFQITGDFLKL